MPRVEVSRVIAAPRPEVYGRGKNVEELARHMPDVVKLEVLERGPASAVTRWTGRLQGRLMTWTERDEYDDAGYRHWWKQIQGDLKQMEGEFRYEEVPEGTKVTITCDFDLGMAMWANLLNPIATIVVRDNLTKMLEALEGSVKAAG